MLVHPSQRINSHDLYKQFINARLGHWTALANSESQDERGLLRQEVASACGRLASTHAHLEVTPDEVVEHFNALRQEIEVRTVNSESDIDIDWDAARGWILVGGANLDRGFTIPGLAVTYMPRGAGQGNVDTLQQRGRFFGYITPLLNECRVYLDEDVLQRYRDIALHERDVHGWLRDAARSERNVREIRRRFVLSEFLRPTRREVMDPASFVATAPEWFEQSAVPKHLSLAGRNKALIDTWLEGAGAPARQINENAESAFQRHIGYLGIPLRSLLDLLKAIALGDPEETQRWCAAVALLDAAVRQDPALVGSVLLMRPDVRPKREVTNGVLRDLLQGRGEANGYLGDRGYTYGSATLQIHTVDLCESRPDGATLSHEKVTVLALRVSPRHLQRVVGLDSGTL
jgi:hypothetical protein